MHPCQMCGANRGTDIYLKGISGGPNRAPCQISVIVFSRRLVLLNNDKINYEIIFKVAPVIMF